MLNQHDPTLASPPAGRRRGRAAAPSVTGRRKIVFCATSVLGLQGGIASANRNVLAALADTAREEGLALDVLALHEGADPDSSLNPADARYRVFNGNSLAFAAATAASMLSAKLLVFDHVHLALPLLAVPRPLLPPHVIFAHGSESWRRIRPRSIRLFQRADRVLTNSHYTLRRMQAIFDGFEGRACPLGLPLHTPLQTSMPASAEEAVSISFADGIKRPLGSRVLILVGRMHPNEREKGHRELMTVLPRLRASFPDVQLLFVGPGEDREPLMEFAREMGVADSVAISGGVSGDQLAQFYRKSYAMVMPSRQEGFGLVYLEAMNWAKPCLACRDDGGGEVIAEGETGLLVPQPLDLEELYAAVGRLLADPLAARRMGEAGWARLHRDYTAGMYQGRLREEFVDVLRRGRGRK